MTSEAVRQGTVSFGVTMNEVGTIGLIAALAFAAYGVIAGALGGKLRSPRMV